MQDQLNSNRLLGTHLYPYVYFANDIPRPLDERTATEVISTVAAPVLPVHITRNGGLFAPYPVFDITNDPGLASRAVSSRNDAIVAINNVICELSLLGVVSEPAAWAHMGIGYGVANRARVYLASGGREFYEHRTLAPIQHYKVPPQPSLPLYKSQDPSILSELQLLRRVSVLSQIGQHLPLFVGSAYSFYSEGEYAQAITNAWVACELMLYKLWKTRADQLDDPARKKRLLDTRSYSAAIQTEVLYTAAAIPNDIYLALNVARKRRNDLVHSGEVSFQGAADTMKALKQFLEYEIGLTVADPIPNISLVL
jgi:hypothetical protein